MKIDRARFLSMVAAISAGGGMTATAHADQPAASDSAEVADDRVAQACTQPWGGGYPAACTGVNPMGWEVDYCVSMSESMADNTGSQMVSCFNQGGNIYDCIESSLAGTCPTNEAVALCQQIGAMCGGTAPALCAEMMSGLYYHPQKMVAQNAIDTSCTLPMWSAVEGIFL